jgi:molybdate transport system regulatory protein
LTEPSAVRYNRNMDKKFRAVISVRIFSDEKCFGPGIAVLLTQVRELHSLRAAAMSIGMAYSKAWTIVKNSEANLGCRLLDSTTGGKHGGGAELTAQAEAILSAYEDYIRELRACSDRLFAEKFEGIL